MSEDTEDPLLTVLFYGQLSCVIAAVAVWIAVLFGPLVNPWFFLIMAVGAILGLTRAYLGKQKSEEAERTVIQGEAGVFHALAVEDQPITARALSNILPHTLPDMKYRLQRLEEKDLIGVTERDGSRYYYVKSTGALSTSGETTDASTASGETSKQSDDERASKRVDEETAEIETE